MYKKVKAKKKMAFLQINNDNFLTDKTVSHLAGINPGMVYIYMLMLMATSTDGFPGILQYGDSAMYTYIAAIIGKSEKLSLIRDTMTALIDVQAVELHDGVIVFNNYYKYIGEAYKDTCTYNAYCKAKSESEEKEKRTVENKSGARFTIPKRKIEEWKAKYKYINVENVIDEYIATNIDSEKKEKVLMSIAHVLIESNNKAIDKLLSQHEAKVYAPVMHGITINDYTLTADDINRLQAKYNYIDVSFVLDDLKKDVDSGRHIKCIKSAITNKLRACNDMAKKEAVEEILTAKSENVNYDDAKYEAEEAKPEKSVSENWAEFIRIYPAEKQKNATTVEKARLLYESYSVDKQVKIVEAAKKYTAKGMPVQYMSSIVDFVDDKYKEKAGLISDARDMSFRGINSSAKSLDL